MANNSADSRSDLDPAVLELAEKIVEPGQIVTWLNHWSIGRANWSSLQNMSSIGVDGTLLQMLMRFYGFPLSRTSADLVLPVLFSRVLPADASVVLIGANPGVAQKAAQRLESTYSLRAQGFDGYEELRELRANPQLLTQAAPDVIVLGLGAGLQDEVAIELSKQFPNASICTAGGWIDQFAAREQYFPGWIHRLRLGWAWRIAHEPRRLLRRYTTDAVAFVLGHRKLVRNILTLPHRATSTGLDKVAGA